MRPRGPGNEDDAPPHGKPAPLLADEARSAPGMIVARGALNKPFKLHKWYSLYLVFNHKTAFYSISQLSNSPLSRSVRSCEC